MDNSGQIAPLLPSIFFIFLSVVAFFMLVFVIRSTSSIPSENQQVKETTSDKLDHEENNDPPVSTINTSPQAIRKDIEFYQELSSKYSKYIATNFAQNRIIFYLTVATVLVGFIFLISGAFIATVETFNTQSIAENVTSATVANSDDGTPSLQVETKNSPFIPILLIVSGIIIEFIATVIAVIYRASTKQTLSYFLTVRDSLEYQYAFDVLGRIEKARLDTKTLLNARLKVIELILTSKVKSQAAFDEENNSE